MIEFPHKWDFLLSAPKHEFLPIEGPIEIAFCGRSNVGKSSLINALTYSKSLARTSNTPGRTQELNFFIPTGFSDIPPLTLVDMPGYGYASAPTKLVKQWTRLIFDYLRGRTTLRRVYVLIDSRHGVKKNDKEVLDLLDKTAVSYQVILTKIDKISKSELEKVINRTILEIAKRPAAYPELLHCSASKLDGINNIRNAIVNTINY